MTKKDYIRLAQALREVPSPNAFEVWLDCVQAIASALKEDNPRFKYETFA